MAEELTIAENLLEHTERIVLTIRIINLIYDKGPLVRALVMNRTIRLLVDVTVGIRLFSIPVFC